MKRSFWFASGDMFLPKSVRRFLETYIIGSDTSLFYISIWSFVHMFTGILFALMVKGPIDMYVWLHTIWEVWQIAIGMTPIHTARGMLDIFTDTAMGVIGVIIAQ